MKKLSIVVAFTVLSTLQASPLYAGDPKLGKLFIKAAPATVDGQQFPDQGREDSVKDLKERAGKFVVVDNEKEADYLLIVVERSKKSSGGEIIVTLSFKQNGQWKPGTRLTASSSGRGLAARRIMSQANDWVEAREEQHKDTR